jgi:uncharacterized protein
MAHRRARCLSVCERPSSIGPMRKILLFVVLSMCVVFARFAFAQQDPLMGSEASPTPPVSAAQPQATPLPGFGGEDGVYRILVIGDGLAGGLGNGMMRMAEADPRFEILNRFNESSGLARPEVYDWAAAIPKIVENAPVDAIVVLVGLNDRQGIRSSNARYVFKGTDWQKAYVASVDRVLASAKQVGAKIFWISLPPMENRVFDEDMQYLNGLHKTRVAAVGGNYVDVRPFFVGPDGGFVDRGPDDTGNERKLRERDGVKFMKVGNNRFGQLVLGALKTLEAGSAPPAAVAAVEPAPAVVAALPKPALPASESITVVPVPPSFGQSGLNGEDLTFRADVVRPIVKPPVSVAVRTAAQVQSTASTVPGVQALSGSRAQQLFEKGLAAPAPAGRFDDFTVPAVE